MQTANVVTDNKSSKVQSAHFQDTLNETRQKSFLAASTLSAIRTEHSIVTAEKVKH